MKPYGSENQKWFWRDEEYGPSSKHCKMKSKNRREWRRILHKKGRNNSKKEILSQLS